MQVTKQLENFLLKKSLLTPEQLAEAKAKRNGKSLFRTIADLGFASEKEIARCLAEQLHYQFVDLSNFKVNPNAATLISPELAEKNLILPIDLVDENLTVAMANPANVIALDDIRLLTGKNVKPVVVTESDLLAVIDQFKQADSEVKEIVDSVADGTATTEVKEEVEDKEVKEAPVVKLVNLILMEAARERANDVHIEPQEKEVRIRFRIDGVLHEMMKAPKKIQNGIISRLKIMAGMDIAERRLPQDGRFSVKTDDKLFDFRVATLPTVFGEKVVLRLLDKEAVLMDLNDLGFLPESLVRFKSSFTKPYGAILVTGPTGSGKTTTLYAALNVLNSVEKNIITVEDPVEYRLAGINQVQVNPKAEMTFAAALRSILRNDPDIVMIGEIRDQETAVIAIESALTGHLVLSTLHTNDAASSLTRLTEMKIEPFLISSAVDCIVAQRLARKLCADCKEAYTPSDKALATVGFPKYKGQLYRARGCKRCNNTGYKGRIGLYEVLLVSEKIERLIVKKATAEEITKVAITEGMQTLRQDGFAKVISGITSIEEIMRVTV